MSAQKTKTKRKWIKWVVLAVIVVVVAGVIFIGSRGASMAAQQAAQANTALKVAKGDISVIVQASGSISAATSESAYAPLLATVSEISGKNGDYVKTGDNILTLSSSTLDDEIANLTSTLTSTDGQLKAADTSKSSKIYATVPGRIKAIYAVDGQTVSSSMQGSQGLLLISVDDKLVVTFTPSAEVAIGDPVTLKIGDASVDSTISTYINQEATVVFADDAYDLGQTATITNKDGTSIGEGSLHVNFPFYVTGSEGVVSKIRVGINDKVSVGDTLVDLEYAVYSDSYQQLLNARQSTLEQLTEKVAIRDNLTIKAPKDGLLSGLTVTEGNSVPQGTALFAIASTDDFDLVVAVDELDIASVALDQTANIAIDALSDAVYTGKVTRISGGGTYNNGVTTYDVTVKLDKTDKIMSAMSARADIEIASAKQVVLVPATAIKTVNGEKYVVVLPDPSTPGSVTAEGVETKVTVGLSNGAFVQILSGVSEGQYVKDLSAKANTGGFFGMSRPNNNTGEST